MTKEEEKKSQTKTTTTHQKILVRLDFMFYFCVWRARTVIRMAYQIQSAKNSLLHTYGHWTITITYRSHVYIVRLP